MKYLVKALYVIIICMMVSCLTEKNEDNPTLHIYCGSYEINNDIVRPYKLISNDSCYSFIIENSSTCLEIPNEYDIPVKTYILFSINRGLSAEEYLDINNNIIKANGIQVVYRKTPEIFFDSICDMTISMDSSIDYMDLAYKSPYINKEILSTNKSEIINFNHLNIRKIHQNIFNAR